MKCIGGSDGVGPRVGGRAYVKYGPRSPPWPDAISVVSVGAVTTFASRKSQVCDIVENPVMVTQNVIITALCDGHGA